MRDRGVLARRETTPLVQPIFGAAYTTIANVVLPNSNDALG
jgi:hypothetical protein